jgi:hypothetical protein
MGWAARANPIAQARRRRELAPRVKAARPLFKRRDYARMWADFLERLAGAATPSKKDAA